MSVNQFKEFEKKGEFLEIIASYEDLSSDALPKSDYFTITYIASKAYFLVGKGAQSMNLLPPVIEWAEKNDKQLFMASSSLLANCYTSQGKFKDSQHIFRNLLDSVENIHEMDIFPTLLVNYGHTFFYLGDVLSAHEQYSRALAISQEKRLPDARILSSLALTYSQMGEYKKATEFVEEVIAKKEDLNDWHGWVIAKINASMFYNYLGDVERAHDYVDQARQYAENKFFMRELAGAHSVKGSLLIRDKKILEAYDHLQKAYSILTKIGVKDILPELLARLGFITILLEEYSETSNLIEELTKIAEEQQSHYYVIWSTCLESLLLFERDKDENALKVIEKAVDTALDFKLSTVFFQASYLACYLFAAAHNYEYLEKQLTKTLKIARDQNSEIDVVKTIIGLGLLYLSQGLVDKLMPFEDELKELSIQFELYSTDITNLGNYYAEIAASEDVNQQALIKEDAQEYLLDFLQRTNPWF